MHANDVGTITVSPDDKLERAVEIGKLLIEVKSKKLHGEWLPWLSNHFSGNVRTAQRYMRSARVFQGDNLERHKHLTLSEAEAILKGRKLVNDRGRGRKSET
jgi:hypothetical protein